MTLITIPNRPAPSDSRDINAILADFDAITAVVNGNLDYTNLSAATLQSASVNSGSQTVKGAVNIATSESTSSTPYTLLATPDRVTGVVLPANGLIAVWYQATWQANFNNAGSAAIFIGANQLQANQGAGATQQSAVTANAGISNSLTTTARGLDCIDNGNNYTGDVTTGQAVYDGLTGGPCYIFAAAGTYTISVQFAAGGRLVTVSNRKLWVQALSFA